MATDASVDALRLMIGAQSTKDDGLLALCLNTAGAYVQERIYPDSWNEPDVQHAVLLLANRLYKRRTSPEGTAGFQGEGIVVRILSTDPDVRTLLERHVDMSRVGIG